MLCSSSVVPNWDRRLYSENQTFHWSLNNNSNNNCHCLTICYFMFVYGWSVLGLRFWLFILCFYPMGSFVLRVEDDLIGMQFHYFRMVKFLLSCCLYVYSILSAPAQCKASLEAIWGNSFLYCPCEYLPLLRMIGLCWVIYCCCH